jgi:hypothetical protein
MYEGSWYRQDGLQSQTIIELPLIALSTILLSPIPRGYFCSLAFSGV